MQDFGKKSQKPLDVGGFKIFTGWFAADQQMQIVDEIRELVRCAPLFHPITSRGRKMSVRMTSAGDWGWISDHAGYRYERLHPNGAPWPEIPEVLLETWARVTGLTQSPNSCLVNYYGEAARMGLHQDKDEGDFSWPVVSVSLGDEALFRIGGVQKGGSTQSIWLESGDLVVMGGAARLAYHGIDRIRFGSSKLLQKGGRINLTLRVVDISNG